MFQPCKHRRKVTVVQQDGSRIVVERCGCIDCVHFTQDVTPEVCNGCDKRLQPPPKLSGAKPSKPLAREKYKLPKHVHEDSRIQREVDCDREPYCDDRKRLTLNFPCGRIHHVWRCNSRVCAEYNKLIEPKNCETCRHRVDGGVAVYPLTTK